MVLNKNNTVKYKTNYVYFAMNRKLAYGFTPPMFYGQILQLNFEPDVRLS